MYPASFEYHRVTSVPEALSLLQRYPDEARLLAGGHSLIPLMKLRLAQPKHLIDLRRVEELRGIRASGGEVVIGAMTTYHEIEESDLLQASLPILPDAAARVGDLQVRGMGTLGGSLAHADPAADFPAVVLALGATLVAVGPRGEREIAADDFFTGLLSTALEPDEVLTAVRIAPPAGNTGAAYDKYPHPASGYALCGAAAVVTLDGDRIASARVAVTGVVAKATRAVAAEQALGGSDATLETIQAAAERVVDGLELRPDAEATDGYNAQLTRTVTRRALERAVSRARA